MKCVDSMVGVSWSAWERRKKVFFPEQFRLESTYQTIIYPCLPEMKYLTCVYSSPRTCFVLLRLLYFGSGLGPGLVVQPEVNLFHELCVQLWMEAQTLGIQLYEVLRSKIKFKVVSWEDTQFSPPLLLQSLGNPQKRAYLLDR